MHGMMLYKAFGTLYEVVYSFYVIKLGCHCELCHALRLNGVLKGMCTQVNACIIII